MFSAVRGHVLAPGPAPANISDRLRCLGVVGYKACGLDLLPRGWTPPFLVVAAELYRQWQAAEPTARNSLLKTAVADLEFCLGGWVENWPYGLALRSSATSELCVIAALTNL